MEKYVAMEEELERGREFANQLRELMSYSCSSKPKGQNLNHNIAKDLVANVLASFTNTLFLFNNINNNVSPSSSSIPSNSQHTTTSNNTITTSPSPKRRKSSSHSWEQVSEISSREDGHAWRKYGQKMILNNKHPRNYYRCTHKFEQGCQATKQVQRIQDEPPLYRTTYYGHHTCTNFFNPQIILDSPPHLSNHSNSFLLSFANNTQIPIPNPFLSSSSSFPINPIKNDKQENMKQLQDNVTHDINNLPSSSSNHHHQFFTTFESQHNYGDVNISSPLFYDHPLPHHHDLDALIFNPYQL